MGEELDKTYPGMAAARRRRQSSSSGLFTRLMAGREGGRSVMEEEHNFLSAASFCPTSQETGDRSGIAHLVKCPKKTPCINQQNEDVLGTWVFTVIMSVM